MSDGPTGPPLIVELQGRVGNQLFQFALGYASARRIGSPLRFSRRLVGDDALLEPGCLVIGFFQNEGYFVDDADEIDALITLPDAHDDCASERWTHVGWTDTSPSG